MVGAIIVSICAASLVVGYMLIVNVFLRSDEHYHSQDEVPEAKPKENRSGAQPRHAHA